MDYTAYRAMAERELTRHRCVKPSNAVRERRTSWSSIDSERSDLATRASPSPWRIRIADPRYEASRYIIEQLKQRVPIWKLEHYVDGSREWVATPMRTRETGRRSRRRPRSRPTP